MRKPGGKNTDGMPDRGQQVSVIAQENLKLAAFLFYHRWKCTLDWEMTEVDEGTVHLLAGKKKLKDEYKDPSMLPKINKSDMASMMESIKEYLRSHCCIIKAPLAYVIRKSIIVQTYDEYFMYSTSDDEMITRMLHLPPDKNNLLLENDVQRVQVCIAEYRIDNRTVYDILDQICNDIHIHMSSSISPRETAEGHSMPSTAGG